MIIVINLCRTYANYANDGGDVAIVARPRTTDKQTATHPFFGATYADRLFWCKCACAIRLKLSLMEYNFQFKYA